MSEAAEPEVTEEDAVTEEANETPDADLEPDTEPDEDEAEDEDETEAEPEARVRADVTILAERDKRLESERKRHENAVKKAYADDADRLYPCPLCDTEGWMEPIPPGEMPDEMWEVITAAAGRMETETFLPAHHAQRCEYCDGWGEVLSGSQNPTHRLVACPDCTGTGWRARLEQAPVQTFQIEPLQQTNGTAVLDWTRPRDQWNRPEGHPHFGMAPELIGL